MILGKEIEALKLRLGGIFGGALFQVARLAWMVAPKQNSAPKTKAKQEIPRSETDVAIIGGGVVGVIAAKRMQERGIKYRVIEKLPDFGGVWHTHANNHSTLQVHSQYATLEDPLLIKSTGSYILTSSALERAEQQIQMHHATCETHQSTEESFVGCRHQSCRTGHTQSTLWARGGRWSRSAAMQC
jgi:heterodisulfide reductase subunit A-like polyferredoxin